MIDKVIGSVVPLVRLPITLVEGIESVIEQATHLATRAAVVIDRAEVLADKIDALVVRSSAAAESVEAVVADAAASLAAVRPAVDALASVPAETISSAVAEAIELLPALRSLEQLVPVVSQLGTQVDNLDRTVADVGALLGGIPGAARLLKRGETARPAR